MGPILPPLLILAGPTASGKTDLAVRLAKKFNGEIINADSRTVYKELNIATAKPPLSSSGFYGGVKHHLFNLVSPKTKYDLTRYQQDALKTIRAIHQKGKLPILVGGTGLYIRAITDNLTIPKVGSDPTLASKNLAELVLMLKKLDPKTAQRLDLKNPRRVVRALTVRLATGKSFLELAQKGPPLFNMLYLCLDLPREKLYERIDRRVDQQIKQGLIRETKKLVKKYGLKLPAMSGIGYRQINDYLQGKYTLDEAAQRLKWDTHAFARRQLTWFRKEPRAVWIKNQRGAKQKIKQWLP